MGNSKNTVNINAWGFFRYFKNIVGWHIYGLILLNIFVGLLDGFGLALFVPLLAIATKSSAGEESLGKLKFLVDFIENSGLEVNLVTVLLLMIFLFILKGILYYIKSLYFVKIRLLAIRKIRIKLVDSLRNISYQGFTELDAGRIQHSMVGEANRLISSMVQYFNTIQNIILLLTYIFLAFLSNWQFAIMVALGGLSTNFIYQYINKVTKEYSRKLSKIGSNFNGLLIQAINHFKYLKATNSFKVHAKRLRNTIVVSEDYTYKIGKVGAIAESLREPLIIVVIAIVILIQVEVLHKNFDGILVSLMLFYKALAYLVTTQNTWNSFIGNSAGVEAIEEILNDFNQKKEPEHKEQIKHIGTIDVENVSVTFGNLKVLKDITLNIKSKTSIALVGESGAGKTTLANIICGLQIVHQGKIIVNGSNLFETDLNTYRDKVGYITQEPVIFNDTIFNNVTFWAEKTPENIQKFFNTMEMVSLQSFLNNLDDKEDAQLGNNGILISGGQKQRISIARELYKNVELMIMDEATSALDSETEKYIKDNIDMLHGKFTMVIIAHRLSTIKNVDEVYLMENGKITASGNFNELTEKSSKFKQMVELQEVSS